MSHEIVESALHCIMNVECFTALLSLICMREGGEFSNKCGVKLACCGMMAARWREGPTLGLAELGSRA